MISPDLLRRSSQVLIGVDPDGNIKPLNVDTYGNLVISGAAGNNTNVQPLFTQVINSPDLTKTFNYADVGTLDERIINIQYQSATMKISFTETYTYAGSSGSYRVISLFRSQP